LDIPNQKTNKWRKQSVVESRCYSKAEEITWEIGGQKCVLNGTSLRKKFS
jgi:hypothetical protein